MKANKIRFLAGGLAAVVLMSNMATNVVFAEELEAQVAVEESAPAEESAPSEESAPAEESAPVEESVPAPAEEPIPAPEPVVDFEPVIAEETPAPAPVAEAVPEVPAAPAAPAEPAVEEVGTAKAGNIEETPVVEEVPVSEAPVSEETPEGIDSQALEQSAEAQAERIQAENAKRAADGEIGVAHAGNIEETADPAAEGTTEEQAAEEEPTVVNKTVMRLQGPNPKNNPNEFEYITETFSNGEIRLTIKTINKTTGEVVSESYYRKTTGTQQKLETGDMNEMLAYAHADRVKEAVKAREEKEAAQEQELMDKLGQANTIDELMDKVSELGKNTKPADSYDEQTEEEEGDGHTDVTHEALVKYSTELVKKVVSKAVDKLFDKIPGADYVGGPIKSMLLRAAGIEDEEADMAELVKKSNEELKQQIDQYQGEDERRREIVGSLTSYGNELDAFTTGADMIAEQYAILKKDVADGKITQSEMDVRIAALVGKITNNKTGSGNIFTKMLAAAQTMQGGSDTDPKNRNLFQLFYEYNRETSLFSGEAMDKANTAIQLRVSRYLKNCQVLLEALKTHEKVANLSQDEVGAMSEDSQKIYNKVKSSTYDIGRYMKMVMQSITGQTLTADAKAGDKNENKGILGSCNDYYNKDRLSFIDKNGKDIKEIALSDKLTTNKSENFDKNKFKKSPLNAAQIKKIGEKAKSMNMTVLQYLRHAGFDVSGLSGERRNVFLETGSNEWTYSASAGGVGCYQQGKFFKGINMKKKGAGEEEKDYYRYEASGFTSSKHTNKDDLLVYFQKK